MKTLRAKRKPCWKLTQTITSASVVKHLENIFKSLVIKNQQNISNGVPKTFGNESLIALKHFA